MTRTNLLYVVGTLCVALAVVAAVIIARRPPEPGSAAAFRAMSSASGTAVPYSVPVEARRSAADTCQGYNLELEEGAGIQKRIGNEAEVQRLLSMRQTCGGSGQATRSAR